MATQAKRTATPVAETKTGGESVADFQHAATNRDITAIKTAFRPSVTTVEGIKAGFKAVSDQVSLYVQDGNMTLVSALSLATADLVFAATPELRLNDAKVQPWTTEKGDLFEFNLHGFDVKDENGEIAHRSMYDQVYDGVRAMLGEEAYQEPSVKSLVPTAIKGAILLALDVVQLATFKRRPGSRLYYDDQGTIWAYGQDFNRQTHCRALAVMSKIAAPRTCKIVVSPSGAPVEDEKTWQPNDSEMLFYAHGPVLNALYFLHVDNGSGLGTRGIESKDTIERYPGGYLKRLKPAKRDAAESTAGGGVFEAIKGSAMEPGDTPVNKALQAMLANIENTELACNPVILARIGHVATAAAIRLFETKAGNLPPYQAVKPWAELSQYLSDTFKIGFEGDTETVTFALADGQIHRREPSPEKTANGGK